MPAPRTDPQQLVPLRANWFHILVSLADLPRHGYGIMLEVERRTRGEVHLWPATLYGSIRQMLEAGLITATADRPADDDDDPRRRYYEITDFGRQVLTAETRRLERMVEAARAKVSGGDVETTG